MKTQTCEMPKEQWQTSPRTRLDGMTRGTRWLAMNGRVYLLGSPHGSHNGNVYLATDEATGEGTCFAACCEGVVLKPGE